MICSPETRPDVDTNEGTWLVPSSSNRTRHTDRSTGHWHLQRHVVALLNTGHAPHCVSTARRRVEPSQSSQSGLPRYSGLHVSSHQYRRTTQVASGETFPGTGHAARTNGPATVGPNWHDTGVMRVSPAHAWHRRPPYRRAGAEVAPRARAASHVTRAALHGTCRRLRSALPAGDEQHQHVTGWGRAALPSHTGDVPAADHRPRHRHLSVHHAGL